MMNRYDIEQATGVGICSTLESKYRFRTVNTGHPVPLEYWRNRDSELLGGNTFEARKYSGQWVIVQKVPHDNPSDYYNTCLKIAKKRGFVDGAIAGTAASNFFSQDIDEQEVEHAPERVTTKTTQADATVAAIKHEEKTGTKALTNETEAQRKAREE